MMITLSSIAASPIGYSVGASAVAYTPILSFSNVILVRSVNVLSLSYTVSSTYSLTALKLSFIINVPMVPSDVILIYAPPLQGSATMGPFDITGMLI